MGQHKPAFKPLVVIYQIGSRYGRNCRDAYSVEYTLKQVGCYRLDPELYDEISRKEREAVYAYYRYGFGGKLPCLTPVHPVDISRQLR